jgi:hypothetical protein
MRSPNFFRHDLNHGAMTGAAGAATSQVRQLAKKCVFVSQLPGPAQPTHPRNADQI